MQGPSWTRAAVALTPPRAGVRSRHRTPRPARPGTSPGGGCLLSGFPVHSRLGPARRVRPCPRRGPWPLTRGPGLPSRATGRERGRVWTARVSRLGVAGPVAACDEASPVWSPRYADSQLRFFFNCKKGVRPFNENPLSIEHRRALPRAPGSAEKAPGCQGGARTATPAKPPSARAERVDGRGAEPVRPGSRQRSLHNEAATFLPVLVDVSHCLALASGETLVDPARRFPGPLPTCHGVTDCPP